MSTLFSSIDETLLRVKNETETLTQSFKDKIFALETELALHKSLTAAASSDRDKFMRIATKLVTQFATVEKVFSDAKQLALSLEEEALAADPPSPIFTPKPEPEPMKEPLDVSPEIHPNEGLHQG